MKRILSVLVIAAPLAAQEPNAGALRIVVTPANPVVTAGDSLRLSAQVVDASGKAVGGVRVRYFDFLHPAIPGGLVALAEPALEGLERVPLLRAISGSLLIHAER